MRSPVTFRFPYLISVSLLLALTIANPVGAQQKTAAEPAKPKIRAITAFVNLEREHYRVQISDALTMLKRAQTIFESRGYQVQTIRIATQPFPEYTKGLTAEQTVEFFKEYDALAIKEKFAASIGPAMLKPGDGKEQAALLATILSNTKTLNGSVVVAGWSALARGGRGGTCNQGIGKFDGAQPGKFPVRGDCHGAAADSFFSGGVPHRIRAPVHDRIGIGKRGRGDVHECAGRCDGTATPDGFAGGCCV
jgi:hypothetical protein